uniref:Phosphoglycerate kinase n=1 Tax=Zeugodacus cucurbitae TaxID=28588 RepID=A0A0A1XH42_ZEUCU
MQSNKFSSLIFKAPANKGKVEANGGSTFGTATTVGSKAYDDGNMPLERLAGNEQPTNDKYTLEKVTYPYGDNPITKDLKRNDDADALHVKKVATQKEDVTTSSKRITVHSEISFPHYMLSEKMFMKEELISESSLAEESHEFLLSEEKTNKLVEEEEKYTQGVITESNQIEENIEDKNVQQYRSKSCRSWRITITPIVATIIGGDIRGKKIPDNNTTYRRKNNMLDSRMKKKYHYVKKLIYKKMITLLKKRSNALEIDKKTLLQSTRKRREQLELSKYSQQILFEKVSVVKTIWELLIPWQLMLDQIWRLHKTELLNITLKATLELGARCPGRYKGVILAASQHFNSQKVIEAPVNQPMMEVNEVPNPQVIVQQETLTTSINHIKELHNIVLS